MKCLSLLKNSTVVVHNGQMVSGRAVFSWNLKLTLFFAATTVLALQVCPPTQNLESDTQRALGKNGPNGTQVKPPTNASGRQSRAAGPASREIADDQRWRVLSDGTR